MLHSRIDIPHPTTLSRDVKEVFGITQTAVIERLKLHLGLFHLCIDGWTSPNIISFLGVTLAYVEGDHIVTFILDFIKYVTYFQYLDFDSQFII